MRNIIVRQRKTLRVNSAIAAGATQTPWSMEDIVNMIDQRSLFRRSGRRTTSETPR